MERRTSRQFYQLLIFLFYAILTSHIAISSAVDMTGGDQGVGYFVMKSDCNDVGAGECMIGGDEEVEMEPESNRRELATRQYVGYGALRRNTVPCSKRGASYYNCRVGAQANPYSHSCSQITRCRR